MRRAIYVAIGVNLEGNKEVLGLWVGQSEGAKYWLQVVTELKNGGCAGYLHRLRGRIEGIAAGDRNRVSKGQMWRRNGDQISPFFAYPAEIGKVIYTTNAVESMALERIARNRTRPLQGWKAALNRFAILLENRVPRAALV